MILNKRLLRELKRGFVRYGAMSFLIILSLSLVISLAGGTDTVNYTVDQTSKAHNVEDGEFGVHVPLTDKQLDELTDMGVKVEEKFYADLSTSEGVTLRIFKNRFLINTITLDDGELPTKINDIVIEKHYSGNFNLGVGDDLVLDGRTYIVSGIGTVPDYNNVVQNRSDVLADMHKFSICFVSEESFQKVIENSANIEYEYSYVLGEDITDNMVKEYLIDMEFDEVMIKNPYMREIVEGLESTKTEFTDAVTEIVKGSTDIKNGVDELSVEMSQYAEGMNAILGETNEFVFGAKALDSGTKDLKGGVTEYKEGVTKFQDKVLQFIDENMGYEYLNLTYFLKAEENQRITSCEDDVEINKVAALFAGVIIFILIAYMLAVFSVHNIEKESGIIGTLYSMGYVKKELLKHFMILPVGITGVASVIGTFVGLLQIPSQVADSADYYSFPKTIAVYPPYLIAFGIIMPITITIAINYIVLNNKLKAEPLKLLRKENKQLKISNIDLKNMGFINRYRIRQMIREIRGNITLFCGLFVAILLMMLGFSIYGCIDNYVKGITDDVRYQYQYLLSYPPDKVPSNAEIAYTESLSTYLYLTDSDMEVALQGITKDSPYFDFADQLSTESSVVIEKNDVLISDSASYKFGWKVGDDILLSDTANNISYTFRVKEIVDFASGLYIFLDIDNMRDIFNREDDYFNTLFSDKEIEIESGRVASLVTRDEMKEAAEQMYDMMEDMIVTIIVVSVILFMIVMYLLLKMMIDKSTFSISLIKVFGYNEKEVKKLYLGSNFYTVLITIVISIPLTKAMINKIYPNMVANVAAGMPTTMPPYLYGIMIAIIFGAYFTVNRLLSEHLKKVSLVEILKERE